MRNINITSIFNVEGRFLSYDDDDDDYDNGLTDWLPGALSWGKAAGA
jgi:hypothetical protein